MRQACTPRQSCRTRRWEDYLELQAAPEDEEIVWDYASNGLTLRRHPLALLRPKMAAKKLRSSRELQRVPNSCVVRTRSIVTLRQQPAHGQGDHLRFLGGRVWVRPGDRVTQCARGARQALLESHMLAVTSMWQRSGAVRKLIADRLVDLHRGWEGWGKRAGISGSPRHLKVGAFNRDFVNSTRFCKRG